MSVSQCVCVCAGAHVTQCWAIDLLLAISRICCQDMLGICWLSCFPSPSPSPRSPCSALTIESQFRVRVTCSFVQFMAQHHLYEHFSVPAFPCTVSCQRLFMPFNKFTLPATVPNTCLLPLLQQRLLSAAVPRSKCNFKLALQHHRLHSKLARPKITYRIANASLMQ